VFLDAIGRTIIAEKYDETNDKLKVKNPAVVNITPQRIQDPATGQVIERMALQLFPLFFREFLAAKDEPVTFCFNKQNITIPDEDLILDFKVSLQYNQLFVNVGTLVPNNQPAPKSANPEESNTPKLKLFDEE